MNLEVSQRKRHFTLTQAPEIKPIRCSLVSFPIHLFLFSGAVSPILSMCHSAQHSLAKWLVEVLNPILEFYSGCYVEDFHIFDYPLSSSMY